MPFGVSAKQTLHRIFERRIPQAIREPGQRGPSNFIYLFRLIFSSPTGCRADLHGNPNYSKLPSFPTKNSQKLGSEVA